MYKYAIKKEQVREIQSCGLLSPPASYVDIAATLILIMLFLSLYYFIIYSLQVTAAGKKYIENY